MSDNDPKNWDDERLIKLLDSALSSHAYMKEELDKTEWKLAEVVEKLLEKYHDAYEDWRTSFRNIHKKNIRAYVNNLARLIKKLGFKEGKKDFCENNNKTIKPTIKITPIITKRKQRNTNIEENILLVIKVVKKGISMFKIFIGNIYLPIIAKFDGAFLMLGFSTTSLI